MADSQILYVSKDSNHHESITHLGAGTWKWTKAQVVASIDSKTNTFFTLVNGKRASVGVKEGTNGKYLQTHADREWSNNLLSLPDFP